VVKYPHSTPYLLVAGSISVVEIATPLTTRVLPTMKLDGILEELMTKPVDDWFCLVCDEQRVYGYLTLDDNAFTSPIEGWRTAGESATPITADIMVAASTSLLDFPALFLKNYFFFILTGNEITHVVSFQDMDKLPMKLCLFSLVMELESKLLELLSIDSASLERYLGYLSPDRLRKAQDLCKMKYKGETLERLLLCTTFIDKKQILRQVPEFAGKLPFRSNNEIDRAFKRIENVRNQIAHGDSVITVLSTPEEFSEYVNELKGIIVALSEMEKEKRPESDGE